MIYLKVLMTPDNVDTYLHIYSIEYWLYDIFLSIGVPSLVCTGVTEDNYHGFERRFLSRRIELW